MLSESVGKTCPEALETSRFVLLFDKFFDILNVRRFDEGAHKRKKFLRPYRNGSDERLEVCYNSARRTALLLCIVVSACCFTLP